MVLNEKHDEQNQQRWISRAKRERLNLSASVEEALDDPTVDEMSWGEELDGQANFPERSQGKGIFPPRLSLQSRPVPALRSDNSVETRADAYTVVPSEQERGLAAPIQNTNILKRFAQRLTSSFAALGGAPQPEMIESSLRYPQEEAPEKSSGPFEANEGIQQSFVSAGGSISQERTVPQRPIPADDGDEPRDRQSKQRLAGRTTRIHLETPPTTAIAKSRQSGGNMAEKSYSDTLQRDSLIGANELPMYTGNDATANAPEMTNSSSPYLPATAQVPVEVNSTGGHLSAVDKLKGKVGGAPHRALSGSGIFESGQSDATVVNRYVTEASVVLVTLTANPGPVVIQYVTLRPRIGFTVHLTAPTTMRASFNYIVLLGELF